MTATSAAAARIATWIVAASASMAASGCSEDRPPPVGPIRVLPTLGEAVASRVIRQDFDGKAPLDQWYLTSRRGDAPLSRVPFDRFGKGGYQLFENDLLVRLVEVPPFHEIEARARFSIGSASAAGTGPAMVMLSPVGKLEDGDPFGTRGLPPSLARQLADRVRHKAGLKSNRTKRDLVVEDDHVVETRVEQNRAGWLLWAVVVRGRLMPVVLRSVEVEVYPETRGRAEYVEVLGPFRDSGAHLARAKLHREVRPVVLVSPGESVSVAFVAPADPVGLSFGVGVAPHADAAENEPELPGTRFSCEVRRGRRVVLRDEGEVGGGESPRGFADRFLMWPGELDPGDAFEVAWSNEGEADLLVSQPVVRVRTADARKNLLLISLDTLRADHLGLYGYSRPTSPFLDRLAESAVVCSNFRAVAPYTIPTHATMFTGLYPLRHGTYRTQHRLNPAVPSVLARDLAESGFLTAAFTGGGYVSEDFGFQIGFDRFTTRDPFAVDGVADIPRPRNAPPPDVENVLRWIEERRGERWFAFVHTFAIHDYDPPQEAFALFDTRPDSRFYGAAHNVPTPDFWRDRPRGEPEPPMITAADVEHLTNLYDACIRHVDGELERLFDRLERAGALDDTVVVVTSDHGEELFDHENLGHGVTLYEEQLWIPLLILAPGLSPRRVEEPISQVDLMPTLLDLMGLPVPGDLDGKSRRALLEGAGGGSEPAPIYAHVDTDLSRRSALIDGRLKLIHGESPPGVVYPAQHPRELFDLSRDPGERERLDLAEATASAAADRLEERLLSLEESLRQAALQSVEASVSDQVMEQLRQQGYVR